MNKYRVLSNVLLAAALVLSYVMVGVAAFNYARMICAINHMGASAPANIALIYGIPFGLAAVICFMAYWICRKKIKAGG